MTLAVICRVRSALTMVYVRPVAPLILLVSRYHSIAVVRPVVSHSGRRERQRRAELSRAGDRRRHRGRRARVEGAGDGLRLTDVPVTYPALAPNALTVISLPTSAVPTVYDVPVAPPIADVPRYHW